MTLSLLRFLALSRRLAPFLLVWLLILALPLSRDILKLQLIGSPFTPDLNPSWRRGLAPNGSFDGFAAVQRNPRDLDARVWRFSEMMEGKAAGWGDEGERNQKIYRPAEWMAEALAIQRSFPREKWLVSLPICALGWQFESRGSNSPRLSTVQIQPLMKLTQSAARQDPDNAFYPLLEADLWRKSGNFAPMWQALNRAARCSTLDTHDLERAAALMRAHEAVRPLVLEEKEALWLRLRLNVWRPSENLRERLIVEARLAQKQGKHRRAVEIGVLMLRLGDLMQRGKNSFETASTGQNWCGHARNLSRRVPPALALSKSMANRARWTPMRVARAKPWAPSFTAYAAAHGRGDVAALEKRLQLRGKQLSALPIFAATSGRIPPPTQRDALWRVASWRNAGAFVGVHLLFVAACWVLVNAVMWRGVGAPSSRPDRILPALCLALMSAGMAWWAWQQFEYLEFFMQAGWSPARSRLMLAVATVAMLAFYGAPFLLAVWVAATTLWRQRKQFSKPLRLETELRLAPGEMLLMRSGPTLFCAASLLATLGFWLLFLALAAQSIAVFDPLGWLPSWNRWSDLKVSFPIEMLLLAVLYGLFVDFLAFLLWFIKWRYYAGAASRPMTHGTLRRWKETLGIYLVFGSLIYLAVALGSVPARSEALRELQTQMKRGELPS